MPRSIEFVVDCWVLGCVADQEGEKALAGLAFLYAILRSHRLAVDAQDRIYREYLGQIRRSQLLREWWSLMTARSGKVSTKFARLSRAQEKQLLEELHFDSDDIPYVEVATVTSDRLLVSEDSDYNETVKGYLSETLDVDVLPLGDAERVANAA